MVWHSHIGFELVSLCIPNIGSVEKWAQKKKCENWKNSKIIISTPFEMDSSCSECCPTSGPASTKLSVWGLSAHDPSCHQDPSVRASHLPPVVLHFLGSPFPPVPPWSLWSPIRTRPGQTLPTFYSNSQSLRSRENTWFKQEEIRKERAEPFEEEEDEEEEEEVVEW